MSRIKYEKLTDAQDITDWAKEHRAEPAKKELTPGGSRLTFNTPGTENGEPLSWDAFLKRFSEEKLALLVEPDNSSSHYFKIVGNEEQKDAEKVGMSRAPEMGKHVQTADFRAK